eukprot:CAMPEP_0118948238 /NCGR_PEP_ID=MMETSP1169-20130426/47458_1 /TAXON_ID=36882 /ORGANISM="Pyramimonas obovata, Strain CCMP722" /LENGTH=90 /DNA_ID=CAMNT_0006894619 /DNA_START=127 /DNA_END=399 /DNA_ORIENTATION=-
MTAAMDTDDANYTYTWGGGVYWNNKWDENTQVCKQNTITIMVTDVCPCDHPNPENKINCCGDEPHIDLSAWAFRQVGAYSYTLELARLNK